MSIKSTNINFTTLPTPPIGYSYIGTDLLGNLSIKLDTGVVKTLGVSDLENLSDVNVSGKTIGQVLSWNGSVWTNVDVVTDLSDYYTSGQTDVFITSLSTAISSETSTRSSNVTSLSTTIQFILSGGTFDPSSLSTAISNETNTRSSSDTSLSTSISNEIIIRTSVDTSLSSSILSHSGVTFDPTSLSTGLSNEILSRTSADTSLSTGLSSEISTRSSNITSLSSTIQFILSGGTFDPSSLSTAISNETLTRTSVDTSLSASILSHSGITYNDTSLSSAISTEISDRQSDVTSLSTSILSHSGITYDDTSLSTGLSTEISDRQSDTTSLSTAISSFANYDDTSISTALSTEISDRQSDTTSLSTVMSDTIGSMGTLSTDLSTAISTEASDVTSLSTAIEAIPKAVDLHKIQSITFDQDFAQIPPEIAVGMIYITNNGNTTGYINLGITPTGNEINPYGIIEIQPDELWSLTINKRFSNTITETLYISSSDWTNVDLTLEWSEVTYQNQNIGLLTYSKNIGMTVNNFLNVITTGSKGFREIDDDYTITGWSIVGDVAGSCVVDVRKCNYSTYPTTTSISGSEKITLVSSDKNNDLALTTWDVNVSRGDLLEFYVESASTLTKIWLFLTLVSR